jgi:hypothetical protein
LLSRWFEVIENYTVKNHCKDEKGLAFRWIDSNMETEEKNITRTTLMMENEGRMNDILSS